MSEIVLSTLNARYTHASFGLRYLRANLGEYKERSIIKEFTIKRPANEIAEEILKLNPRILGLGVYIWNTDQSLEVVKILKAQRPDLLIVIGGPEVSFETESQPLYPLVDFVFKGESDFLFREFITNYFEKNELPQSKLVTGQLPEIKAIKLPYDEYTDEDIKHRTLYVEASRGCPYKCEYCLSSLDVSVRNFETDSFLVEIQKLIDRGARQFKFVDRTFNLSPTTSTKILKFFLEQIHLGLFLHFEMVPDRLPDELKDLIKQFPAGSLQFAIGVQTWNPTVARNVSRRQNYEKIQENLKFLRQETGVHTHADLIVGLPGETWESFSFGFNELFKLQPDEIQVGILKRLKGTPIVRHDLNFRMSYSSRAPFQIIENKDLNVDQMIQLEVFADFWDLVANSGRFKKILGLSRVQENPFQFFYDLSQGLYHRFGRTHSIHARDLGKALQGYLIEQSGMSADQVESLDLMPVEKRSAPSNTPARQAMHL